MTHTKPFEVERGDFFSLQVPVQTPEETPAVTTGYIPVFTYSTSEKGSPLNKSKSSINPTIIDSIYKGIIYRTVQILIPSSETIGLDYKTYYWACRLKNGDKVYTISKGSFKIVPVPQ